jgi:hypothetical protein
MQERIGNTLEHAGISNNFMTRTPIIQQVRESIDKYFHQTNKLLHSKGDSC